MTNFKHSLIAVAAIATMAGAVNAQTVSYRATDVDSPTINNHQLSGAMNAAAASYMRPDGSVVYFTNAQPTPSVATVFNEFNRPRIWTPAGAILRETQTSVYCNTSRHCYSSAAQAGNQATVQTTLISYSVAAFQTGSTTIDGLTTTWTNQINAQTGQVRTYTAMPGYVLNHLNQAVRTPTPVANATWALSPVTGQFVLSANPGYLLNNQNQAVAIPAPVANGSWSFNPATSQFTLVPSSGYVMVNGTPTRIGRTEGSNANYGYVSANGTVYSPTQADAWRVREAIQGGRGTFTVANGITFVTYNGNSGTIYYAVIDGVIVGKTTDVTTARAVEAAARKAEADAKAAAEAAKKAEEEAKAKAAAEAAKKKDDHVAERTRKTNATVAGAIAINIIVDELVGEELEKHGAGVGASVGGQFEKPELNLGVAVDLGKHLGEDFEGVSVHAGVGVESGELTVGARKSWQVAEYVQVSVGASIGAQGVRVGPELMICNKYFGIGVAMWGPVPVPQVKIFGYTASVVPHLALANAVVGGSTIAYKAIRSEMKKPVVKEPEAPVAPAVVEVAAQEFDSEEESID